jgi:hypothetical protein
MAIDTSIYQNIRPVDVGSPIDSASRAMSLKHLSLQADAQDRANADAQALRSAFANNIVDGKVNRAGVLSDLAKSSPAALMSAQENFNKADKDSAEATTASMKALHDQSAVAVPHYGYLLSLDDAKAAQEYPFVIKSMADNGVNTSKLPPQWDRATIARGFKIASQFKEQMDNAKTGAETDKTKAETAFIPQQKAADLNASQFGSRSPNAELSSQYGKDVGPIRSSQMAMNQMLDNYANPSPQGDASLILNAFKIKFPTAPDVNSLEELSKSQAVPDAWKAQAAHALQGGLDQATRDNLMRDAGSTFRANYDTYQGIKSRYNQRAKAQNVNDDTLTKEPAIEKTYTNAMGLLKNIGPYVPPLQREDNLLGKVFGGIPGVGPGTASASDKAPAPKAPPLPEAKHGLEMDGYVFMGGDPKKQSNWMRAK